MASSSPEPLDLWERHLAPIWACKGSCTVGDVVEASGKGAYGLALLLVAIPGFVPGLSSAVGPLLGFGAAALGFQMAWGRSAPWLPRKLNALPLPPERVRACLNRLECLLKRWGGGFRWLDRPMPPRLLGWTVFGCGVVLGSPLGLIPMSNAGPSLALALAGASLLEDRPALAWGSLLVILGFSGFAVLLVMVYWHGLGEPGWHMLQKLWRLLV